MNGPSDDGFRLLVECVVDYAIFMLDPHGHVTTWNAGAQRIKGYRADEIVGRHFSVFYPDQTTARDTCELALREAKRHGRFEDEGWRVRKDGTKFWANVVITAVHDEHGTLVGFGKVTRDLTERRRADEDRLRLARSKQHNRIKDEFLATASHELRTPLSAILGWARLLETQVSHDPQAARAVATIVRNAEAQARLIEDLLDASSIVSGKLRLQLGPTDLEGVACAAIDAIRPSAAEKGVRIAFERRAESLVVSGDATRLQQAMWNLLSNAVKFSERDGSIVVALDRVNGHAKLTVRDHGRGIAPEFLPHVFERFRQGSASSRTPGLGLGLAITLHVAELHGGTVEAHSEGLGAGATFTMIIPVVAPVYESEAASEVTRLDGVSVLVVEDHASERELITASLEGRGATVMAAGSVREAMLLLEGFQPRVIVSDIGMPEESGYDFIRRVRERPRDAGGAVPVIALTGHVSSHERRRAFDAGFNNHVPKPLDLEELASLIRNVTTFNR
jgi:PAS domain S-box-containing protein